MHSTTLDWATPIETAVPAERFAPAERRSVLLLVHLTLLGVFVCAGLAESAVQITQQTLLYAACFGLTLSFTWILASWFWLRGSLFEPYTMFMLAAGLFNGGQALLEVFGLNSNGMLAGRASTDALIDGIYLVTVCLLTTHSGALLAAGRIAERQPRNPSEDPDRLRATRRVGWVLLAVAAIPAAMLLWQSVAIVLDYGYIWLYRREESISVIWALTGFLVPGILFLLAGAGGNRWIQTLCLTLTGAYAAINLFLGARGAVVISAVAVCWLFDRSARRLPRPLLVALSLLAVFTISFVREARDNGGILRLDLENHTAPISAQQNPLASSISEMGYSLVTVTHTLALVPSVREFDVGTSYLYAASTIIPNLGWEVHPGKAHGLLSDWLAQTVEPTVAAAGGGLGYSFIAESYLNFGWIGGPLWLGFVGYVVARIFLMGDGTDPAHQAFVAAFLCSFLVVARGESATVVRGVVWYALVPFLMVLAISVRRHRKQVRQCW